MLLTRKEKSIRVVNIIFRSWMSMVIMLLLAMKMELSGCMISGIFLTGP